MIDRNTRAHWPLLFPAACTMLPLFATMAAARADDDDDGPDSGLIQPLSEELLLGETPFPQERHEFQLTISGSHFPGEGHTRESGAAATLEYGITDRLQISLSVPFAFVKAVEDEEDEESGGLRGDLRELLDTRFELREDDDSLLSSLAEGADAVRELLGSRREKVAESHAGLSDIEVEIMYNALRRKNYLLSVALGATFPTGDAARELGEGAFSAGPSLLFGANLGRAQLDLAASVEFSKEETEFSYSAALSWPLRRVVPLVEMTGSAGEETLAYVTPGLVFKLRDNMELNVGAPLGITSESEDWGLVAAYSVEF